MAKNLLAASVVEAAGESSSLALLYLQLYATGVYKGVYTKVKAEPVVADRCVHLGTYAGRGRKEQHAPLNMKRRIRQQAQSELIIHQRQRCCNATLAEST